MLRTVCKQLSSILSASPQTVTTSLKDKIYLHTSIAANNISKKNDRDRDSVRQKGVDVSSSSSTDAQQMTYNKPFGGVTFPTLETFSQTYDGVPFNQLHVIHIKATSNNTIVSVTDGDGVVLSIQSSGTVGFRNARKGTNVAAQAAAIALADDAIRKDIKLARVCLRGIGPGRFPALKAIEMSGIRVVSISDTTPLPHNGNRPKKVRRL